jgi:hypothetical protein
MTEATRFHLAKLSSMESAESANYKIQQAGPSVSTH